VTFFEPGWRTEKKSSHRQAGNELNGVTSPAGRVALAEAIRAALIDEGTLAFDRKRKVADLVRRELEGRGLLCRTQDSRLFYFDRGERLLYDLDERQFRHFLTELTGLSWTEAPFKFTLDLLQSGAARTKAVPVHTLAHFDAANGLLAVSDGGPGVWLRERGGNWQLTANGENGFLFLTDPDGEILRARVW